MTESIASSKWKIKEKNKRELNLWKLTNNSIHTNILGMSGFKESNNNKIGRNRNRSKTSKRKEFNCKKDWNMGN